MKILIVTDAWLPQTNGVVRALQEVTSWLRKEGHDVRIASPDLTRPTCFSLPGYSSIKLELFSGRRLANLFTSFAPDGVHIATEGPLGWTARRMARARSLPFTTAFHTRFPDYGAARLPRFLRPLVLKIGYAILRVFHAPSKAVLVSTPSLERDLRARGFVSLYRWPLGVDLERFQPGPKEHEAYRDFSRPILLYVGRVSVEKNLPAFLSLSTPGTKIVIGEGPDLSRWRSVYPDAHFLGRKSAEELSALYAAADLFVFPSKTDTFGLVLLEAAASGLRIAAFSAQGPADLLNTSEAKQFSALDPDLKKAIERALSLPDDPQNPRRFALNFSWEATAQAFLSAFAEGK